MEPSKLVQRLGRLTISPGAINLDVMECPVCFETCFPPSFICKNGHLVCGKCKAKGIPNCPICRDVNLTICESLDDFMRFQQFRCIHHIFGCPKKYSGYETVVHEEMCKYRPVTCLVTGCGVKVGFCVGLRQHLLDFHPELVGKKNKKIMQQSFPIVGDITWPVHHILIQNSNVVAIHFQIKGKTVSAWGIVPGQKLDPGLTLELTFQAGDTKATEQILKWTGPVLRDDGHLCGLEFRVDRDDLTRFVQDGKLSVLATIAIPSNSTATLAEQAQTQASAPLGWTPTKKCTHYSRNCSLLCPDPSCNGIFGCRICHDEVKTDHKMDRHAVRFVLCHKCSSIQPATKNCGSCGILFGKYFCSICHLYENEKEPQLFFHCVECRICRLRADISTRYTHCNSCGICVPTASIRDHGCRVNAAKENCRVCRKDLHTSKDPISSFTCGHYFHTSCRQRLMGCCPTCPAQAY